MARLDPIPPRDWPEGMKAALAALGPANPRHPFPPRRDDRPKGLNLLGTFARHPELATAFHTLAGHALFQTTLSLRQRELLILRVASLRGATYEWAQHVAIARDLGMTEDEITRCGSGPDVPGWDDPVEEALVRAADELVADAEITDATWATLATELDDQQRMDVVFTVGTYDLLAMAMKSFGVELDDDLGPYLP